MEMFIPGTHEKHSVDDKGIVYSHYKKQNNGTTRYEKKIVAKYVHSPISSSPVVSIWFEKTNKFQVIFVNSLMVELFEIKKPDKYHFYDIINKNGDCFSNGIDNIGFKIRMEKSTDYKFYPQPFYNSCGKITWKICGICGIKKNIKHFHLQKPKIQGQQRTYRNMCESCRSDRMWNSIKNDPVKYEKRLLACSAWNKTEKGILYYENYRKVYQKESRDSLSKHYIASSLKLYQIGLKSEDLTDEMIKIARKKIKLFRIMQQSKIEKNGTN